MTTTNQKTAKEQLKLSKKWLDFSKKELAQIENETLQQSSNPSNWGTSLIVHFRDKDARKAFISDLEKITWDYELENGTHHKGGHPSHFQYEQGFSFTLPDENFTNYSEYALWTKEMNNPARNVKEGTVEVQVLEEQIKAEEEI